MARRSRQPRQEEQPQVQEQPVQEEQEQQLEQEQESQEQEQEEVEQHVQENLGTLEMANYKITAHKFPVEVNGRKYHQVELADATTQLLTEEEYQSRVNK